MPGPLITAPMGDQDVMAIRAPAGQGRVTTEKMVKMEKKEEMEKTDKMRLISM